MTLPHIQIARGHWALGALFLVIVFEEYLPVPGRDGRPRRARSLVVPWGLMLGGAGAWLGATEHPGAVEHRSRVK